MQVTSQAPFLPFHGLQTICEGSFSSLHAVQTVSEGSFSPFHGLQTVSKALFPPFHGLQTICEGPFSPFHGLQTLSRGVRFLLAPLARLLQEVFLPIHQRYLPLETSFFLLFFTPTIAIPYPLSRENHPKIQKKAPFLLFPRHPHCQNPSIPPAWTQGGLATATMPQGEKQESSPWKGGVLYFSRWAIWFYAGGLERSTSSDDQNDCTISSASFSSSLLISIRKSFSLPATQRETR